MRLRFPRSRVLRRAGLIAGAPLLLLAGCGADSRNTTQSAPGATAVPPTTDTAGSVGPDLAVSSTGVRLEKVATVELPTAFSPRPESTDLFVTEQVGVVRRIEVTESAAGVLQFPLAPEPVIDIRAQVAAGGERGLLGLTFSPDGRTLYLYYTAKDGAITVDSYGMGSTNADPGSRVNLLSIPHERGNHNGGALVTGPDGHLYIGTGDGGGGGDPDGNGQRTDTLLGRILRIDPTRPSGGKTYGIPDDNPFADGQGGAPEVWAYGLRNPWRISFDRETDDLWIADVGQNEIEEINRVRPDEGRSGRGANFGWSEMEGTNPFEGGTEPAGHVPPVFEYGHADDNCTVVGGYVYRGEAIPSLRGAYVFGDYCKSEIRGLVVADTAGITPEHRDLGIAAPANSLSSFGEDNSGEVYVLSLGGDISRIVPR